MLLTNTLLLFALIPINDGGKNQRRSTKNITRASNTTFWSKYMFADVPDFQVTFINEQTFSPDGIANQLLQNFFNWFCPTVFWFTILPFYNQSQCNCSCVLWKWTQSKGIGRGQGLVIIQVCVCGRIGWWCEVVLCGVRWCGAFHCRPFLSGIDNIVDLFTSLELFRTYFRTY